MHSRPEIKAYIESLLTERIGELEATLIDARASRDSDAKSTAGNKHEVGRAMSQAEIDRLKRTLHTQKEMHSILTGIPDDRNISTVGLGSLVRTNSASYFISIPLGLLKMVAQQYYVISPASPIGALMMGLRKGDELTFNGKSQRVEEIA